jgi:hypothetical protein
MTETTAPETATVVKTPRCGKETASGPCCRRAGHPTGHMSAKNLATKQANMKARKTDNPEYAAAVQARNAERLANRVAKLEADAEALGFKIVPVKRAAKPAGTPTA